MSDLLTPDEWLAVFFNQLRRECRHVRAMLVAHRWIREHLRPAKTVRRSAYSLKHDFESDCCRYIPERYFTMALRHCGIKVDAIGRVYAKEV
jgi:hypothetical protein